MKSLIVDNSLYYLQVKKIIKVMTLEEENTILQLEWSLVQDEMPMEFS
jgi:hypothetical protein